MFWFQIFWVLVALSKLKPQMYTCHTKFYMKYSYFYLPCMQAKSITLYLYSQKYIWLQSSLYLSLTDSKTQPLCLGICDWAENIYYIFQGYHGTWKIKFHEFFMIIQWSPAEFSWSERHACCFLTPLCHMMPYKMAIIEQRLFVFLENHVPCDQGKMISSTFRNRSFKIKEQAKWARKKN